MESFLSIFRALDVYVIQMGEIEYNQLLQLFNSLLDGYLAPSSLVLLCILALLSSLQLFDVSLLDL